MQRLTPADLAEWRRQLSEEGDGELYDPTVAQAAMPRLMAELEALWAELERFKAAGQRAA